jgi:hypothetical protein
MLTAGCRTFTPVTATELASGAPARVVLTDRGSLELAAALGPRARVVEGPFVRQRDSTLQLRVVSLTRANGVEERWEGQPVDIPLASVAELERSHVSRARSGLMAGGMVAALALAVSALGNPEALSGGGGGRPGSGK